MRDDWNNAKRIVIKIGSALLVDENEGHIRSEWMASMVADIAKLKQDGKEIVIVASGAKALGRQELHLEPGNLPLDQAQAAAAIGQISLTHAFKSYFNTHGVPCAQILLTLGDTEDRRRYLNARDTLTTLLEFGAVPVVNENDTVATTLLRYGDNDRLSARVAAMIDADVLVLLSDIDGLYTAPPQSDDQAKHIPEVPNVTPEIEAMAGGSGSNYSTGGMVTKISAAQMANSAGCHMVITTGKVLNPISEFLNGGKATWFLSTASSMQARKSWIAGALDVKGSITIDKGAEKALYDGNSLLPAGATAVTGSFNRGDVVSVLTVDGRKLAHGLTSYSSVDAEKIIGKHSSCTLTILGYSGRTELIHRDNMALTKGKDQ
jgi:glutamate 5-kinase